VAYNVWLKGSDHFRAREIARHIRNSDIRALGLDIGGVGQVAMNLVRPFSTGPAEAYDLVATQAEVARAELVGLIPAGVLEAISQERWAQLDLSANATIEARLAR
jgi:hypothetical protein